MRELLTLQDIDKEQQKSKIMLARFVELKLEGKSIIRVEAPFEYSRTAIFENPYTEEFFYSANTGLWDFKILELIHDKKRLIKLLWFPYSDQLKEQLIKTQSEFYECYDENQNFICYPVRLHKNIRLTDEDHNTVKQLMWSKVPTFVTHIAIHLDILHSFGESDYVNYFHYFDLDGDKQVRNNVVQFLM